MPRKLTDLRPCDNCNGRLGQIFYVVRSSIAVVNAQAVNELFGMAQFFQGNASPALIENFAPAAAHGFTIAMDEKESAGLGNEIFLCHTCHMGEIDLPLLIERVNERNKATADT